LAKKKICSLHLFRGYAVEDTKYIHRDISVPVFTLCK